MTVFSTNGAGTKSKWIKEHHIKPETLKFIEEKVGKRLKDMGTGEKFLNRTTLACPVRSRIVKWDFIKLQSFCKAKDTVKTKRPPTDWERIFTNPKSDRELISNIYKELHKLAFRASNNPIRNRVQSQTKNSQLRNTKWLRSTLKKKMFNILNHQENANQNNPEIPPHTRQNG